MKNFFVLFIAIVGLSAFSSACAQAQTVVVTDGGAPHADEIRWMNFSTTLSAQVVGIVKAHKEWHISSKKWRWAGGGPFHIASGQGTPSISVKSKDYGPDANALPKGLNAGSFSAEVVYKEQKDDGSQTRTLVTLVGSRDVKVFVTVPVTAKRLALGKNDPQPGRIVGPPKWGCAAPFRFRVEDQKSNPYRNGKILEDILNFKAATFYVLGPGEDFTTKNQEANFPDGNGFAIAVNPVDLKPEQWNTFVFSFDQYYFDMETTHDKPNFTYSTQLVPLYHVTAYMGHVDRTP